MIPFKTHPIKLFLASTMLCIGGVLGASVSLSPIFSLDNVDPKVNINVIADASSLYIGQMVDLAWGIIESHPVAKTLNLSTEEGSTIELSLNNLATSSYRWLVPTIQSRNALLIFKVTDAFGNSQQAIIGNNLNIDFDNPLPPVIEEFCQVNGALVITWEPSTSTVHGISSTPDTYYILKSSSGDWANIGTYRRIGRTSGIFFVDNSSKKTPQAFYRVTASKSMRNDKAESRDTIKQNRLAKRKDSKCG